MTTYFNRPQEKPMIDLDELSDRTLRWFVLSIVVAYFDISGLLCFCTIGGCSRAKIDCEQAGKSTALATAGIAISILGMCKGLLLLVAGAFLLLL